MYSLQFPVPVPAVAANMNNLSNYTMNKPLSLSSFPKIHAEPCKGISSPVRFRLAMMPKCRVSGNEKGKNIEVELPAGLEAELMPKHVAVIMDGNRRWAIGKGYKPEHGYVVGAEAMKELTRNCFRYGVKVVTLFAVSTENVIRRPHHEAESVINLFWELLISHTEKLMQNNVRVSFIGNRAKLPQNFQKLMSDAEESTKENTGFHVLLGLDYGGRYDITEATKKIATKVKDGVLKVQEIDNIIFEQHLETNVIDEFRNPDLLIRSSGELRVSNFMLWQLAYTEMFFTKKHFPEFDETDLIEAIAAFQQRKRRFGGQKQ